MAKDVLERTKRKKKEKNYFKSVRFCFDQTKMFPFFSSYRFTTDYMLIAKCGVVMNSLTIVSLKTVFVYI